MTAPDTAHRNVRGFRHTGFTVANTERSVEFYRDRLGMVVVAEQEIGHAYLGEMVGLPGVRMRQTFLKTSPQSDHVLELLEYVTHPGEPTPRDTNRPGNGHICLQVADIDALHRELAPLGVVFMSPPAMITHGINRGAKACYMRDPDGFTVELYQPAG